MVDRFKQELLKLNFPNYQNYNEINEAYNDFTQKIMSVIGKVTPIKERCVHKSLRNGLMGKLPMKSKIKINYSKSLKNQNYTFKKIFIMQQAIK